MKALPAFFSLFLSFWVFGAPKPVTRRIPLKNGINLVSIEKKSKSRYLSDTYFPYFLDRDGWKDIDQKAFLPQAICIYGWEKEPLIIDEYDSGVLDWEVEIREGWSILPLKRISTILERLAPGPGRGSSRVLRGGHWPSYTNYLRMALRLNYSPDNRFNSLGFRCVSGSN